MAASKVFNKWNIVKKSLEIRDDLEFFKEGQVWWCNVGQNLGSEVYGKGKTFTRPVLVYRKLSKNLFLAIPLSTKIRQGTWFVVFNYHKRDISALLNQIRVFDKKRLVERLGQVSDDNFNKIKSGFKSLYLS